ncbi:MAG: 1-deoxy-D-xylulose-5-phosphate reductoisomerase [Ignavibacteriales bacterium]|nr:1-deoxy-D-xylulose-5-phosphate reductoisomerase [Ignavibacteriales bacterium]
MSSAIQQIAILGSTGSIGQNSLEVIRQLPDRFRVSYLTANRNIELLHKQIEMFHPRGVVILHRENASAVKQAAGGTVEVLTGEEGLMEIVRRDDVDTVISALVGFAGLKPTIEAIKHRKKIALANKETLVVAGEIITALVKQHEAPLIPVDSEHSAIFQCLVGERHSHTAKLILTASGGPFLHTPERDFHRITVEQALSHPNWKMGNKITIDSATLMNKGLEVIEAHWLFHLPADNIEVVIHPQSIIHSMVEFVDGSVKAQLGLPDMKIPIQYALTYPERVYLNGGRVNFPKLQSMTFFAPDTEKFRCLQLAFDALREGGTMPAVMNAANEVAVDAFLRKAISFQHISELIDRAMSHHHSRSQPVLEEIIDADRKTRTFIESVVRTL